jgi:Pvc16 N-terminal domain
VTISPVAGFAALAATGMSIVGLLNRRFAAHPEASAANLQAFLATALELETLETGVNPLLTKPAISIYCYKVTVDRETRPGWSAVATADGLPRIPLKMHLLVASYADNAEEELRWLGLAAQVLETESVLAGPMLDTKGAWQPDETIIIVPDELALDSVSEAFQALSTNYRLSMVYIARVVCIQGDRQPTAERVATVAARTALSEAVTEDAAP